MMTNKEFPDLKLSRFGAFPIRTRYESGSIPIKVDWQGEIVAIQPRTRVWRYLTHNRSHFHIGYNLFITGDSSDGKKQFVVAISEIQQARSLFQMGDLIKGTACTKQYEEREFADYYIAGSFKILKKSSSSLEMKSSPPWTMLLPAMQTYEQRGARLLSKSLWETKCFKCVWANMANVEIQWDFDRNIKKYRFETFCYGPTSCKIYKPGRARSVPYRKRDAALDDGCMDYIFIENRIDD